MADEIKRVHVRIANVAYQLAASENENYIRQMAVKADEMIRRVLQSSPQLSQNMATVLALVNAMDEISQNTSQVESALRQRDSLERQLAETKTELSRMREQNWEMKKDMLRMQNLLSEFEQHLDKIKQSEINTLGKPKITADLPETFEEDDADEQACNSVPDEQLCNDAPGEEVCECAPDDQACDDAPVELAYENDGLGDDDSGQINEDVDPVPPSLQTYQQSCLEDYL